MAHHVFTSNALLPNFVVFAMYPYTVLLVPLDLIRPCYSFFCSVKSLPKLCVDETPNLC